MRRLFDFIRKNERELASAALVIGFIFDSFTLRRVDFLIENLVFIGYLSLAALSISLLHVLQDDRRERIRRIRSLLGIALQFSFGALFSGFLVFYSRSASFEHSWPLLLLILIVLIGNEFLRRYRSRLVFEISLFFFALLSYTIFLLPVLVKSLAVWVFLLSCFVSLALVFLFLAFLRLINKHLLLESIRSVFVSLALVLGTVCTLYFTNTIPPIPLSLIEAGVYHQVVREGDAYTVVGEERVWYEFFTPDTVHITPGEPLYVFAAVFAPTDLGINIVHHWERYSPTEDRWLSESRVSFPISGGRNEGYRGYSLKTAVPEGRWRVTIETPRRQIIGEVRFTVVHVDELPLLVTETK